MGSLPLDKNVFGNIDRAPSQGWSNNSTVTDHNFLWIRGPGCKSSKGEAMKNPNPDQQQDGIGSTAPGRCKQRNGNDV